jgi:hypothetical protein
LGFPVPPAEMENFAEKCDLHDRLILMHTMAEHHVRLKQILLHLFVASLQSL